MSTDSKEQSKHHKYKSVNHSYRLGSEGVTLDKNSDLGHNNRPVKWQEYCCAMAAVENACGNAAWFRTLALDKALADVGNSSASSAPRGCLPRRSETTSEVYPELMTTTQPNSALASSSQNPSH